MKLTTDWIHFAKGKYNCTLVGLMGSTLLIRLALSQSISIESAFLTSAQNQQKIGNKNLNLTSLNYIS